MWILLHLLLESIYHWDVSVHVHVVNMAELPRPGGMGRKLQSVNAQRTSSHVDLKWLEVYILNHFHCKHQGIGLAHRLFLDFKPVQGDCSCISMVTIEQHI